MFNKKLRHNFIPILIVLSIIVFTVNAEGKTVSSSYIKAVPRNDNLIRTQRTYWEPAGENQWLRTRVNFKQSFTVSGIFRGEPYQDQFTLNADKGHTDSSSPRAYLSNGETMRGREQVWNHYGYGTVTFFDITKKHAGMFITGFNNSAKVTASYKVQEWDYDENRWRNAGTTNPTAEVVLQKQYPIPSDLWNSNPTITVNNPVNNSNHGGSVPLNITLNDPDVGDTLKVYYRIGGTLGQSGVLLTTTISTGTNKTVTGSIPSARLSEGSNTVYMWVEDENGGKSSEVGRVVNVDKTGPAVAFETDGDSTPKKSHHTKVTAVDNNGLSALQYQWTASSTFPTTGAWTAFNSGDTLIQNNGSGNYYLHVLATDSYGNQTKKTSNPFNLDNTPPTSPVINADTGWTDKDVSVTLTPGTDTGGVARTEYSLTGATTKTWTTYSSAFIISNQGQTTIQARTVDIAGNISSISSKVVSIDKTLPTIDLGSNSSNWSDSNIIVPINYNDTGGSGIQTKRYALTETTTKPTSWTNLTGANSQNITITSDGQWYLHVQIIDSAGNERYIYGGPYKLDKTNPTAQIGTPSTVWKNSNISVSVSYSDDMSGIATKQYRITQSTARPSSWTNLTGSSSQNVTVSQEGLNYIHARIVDNAGNETYSYKGPFKLDKTKASLTVTSDINTWVPAPMDLRLKGIDSTANSTNISGVDAIREQGGSWSSGDTYQKDVHSNGTYIFEIRDKAGNVNTKSVTISKIDDIPPEVYETKIENVEKDSIKVTIVGAKDLQSGLHDQPYRFSVDNGNTWTGWKSSSTHEFTSLNINSIQNIKYQVRDKALNVRNNDENVSTLTDEIELNYNKEEGSSEVLLQIDLVNNPAGTETMITRQNLITNETVTIKNWSTSTNYVDRSNSFVGGYRYTAYARNQDKIIGNGSSVVVKDIESPEIELKGYGSDKYIYDNNTQSLFIFGNPSGYVEFAVKTEATDKIIYEITDGIGEVMKEGDSYGRVDEYRYDLTFPIHSADKESYTLNLKAEYSDPNTGNKEIKDLKVDNKDFTVYKIDTLADIFDFNVSPNSGDMDVIYTDKSSYFNSTHREIANHSKIKTELSSLDVFSTNSPTELAKNSTKTIPEGDLTVQKEIGGGTYSEVFKQNSVSISTNISPFVTPLKDEWNLEVYVTTSKGRFTLPRDMTEFNEAGFKLETVVANNKTSINGNNEMEKYQDIKDDGNTFNIEGYTLTEPTIASIGIKVTDVLPTYHNTNLNLQVGEEGGTMTLDAVGNSNIKYDKTFIYNRMNNVMKAHNENIYNNNISNKWLGELYYRSGSENNLLLVTRDKIKVFKPSNLELKDTVSINNTGTVLSNNVLYIGTGSGLREVNNDASQNSTSFTKPVNALTSDGFNLYVASNEGLHILNSSLSEVQFLSNEEIFGTNIQIKSLHTSSGKIYVSKYSDGNEYVLLSK